MSRRERIFYAAVWTLSLLAALIANNWLAACAGFVILLLISIVREQAKEVAHERGWSEWWEAQYRVLRLALDDMGVRLIFEEGQDPMQLDTELPGVVPEENPTQGGTDEH